MWLWSGVWTQMRGHHFSLNLVLFPWDCYRPDALCSSYLSADTLPLRSFSLPTGADNSPDKDSFLLKQIASLRIPNSLIMNQNSKALRLIDLNLFKHIYVFFLFLSFFLFRPES